MNPAPPEVSVVIPAYNRRDSVLQLLGDLYRQTGVAFEVIVVDDCSPDGTPEAIAAAFPQAKVLRNARNGGPAVSRNRGIEAAQGEFIVGVDSDVTVPDRELLAKAAAALRRHPEAAMLAFRLYAADGHSEDGPRWWHPLPLATHAAKQFPTHYFSGTGYAGRRADLLAAGLYPEILYMHYEEVELAFRVLDRGRAILYCPDLPVVHHAHPVAARSKIKVFYKPRNQILVALACYPWPRAFAYLAPRLAYNFAYAIRHGNLADFFGALASAWQLGRQRLRQRAPLAPATWRRIADMRNPDRRPA